MLSEEEIKNLILTLKVYRKQKSLMRHNQKYLRHIIETLEFVINPSIIKKGINPAIIKKGIKRDKVTAVDVIKQACKMVEDEQS